MKHWILFLFFLILTIHFGFTQEINQKKAIRSIFEFKKFQNYLHFELETRVPLYILDNQFIQDDLHFENDSIQIVEKCMKKMNCIEFLKYCVLDDGSIEFVLFYSIENIEFSGQIKKKMNKIEVIDYRILEFR